MYVQQFLRSFIPFVIIIFIFSSCSKDDTIVINEKVTIDEQAESTSPMKEIIFMEMEAENQAERKLCFDLHFPVELIFSDKTTESLNSFNDLVVRLDTWYKENREKDKTEPVLNYPVKATLKDGTVKEVKDNKAFAALVKSCFAEDGKEKIDCFKINFPVNIIFEDETKQLIDNETTLKDILVDRNTEKFTYEFPISIIFKDETFEVKSSEELERWKKRCNEKQEDKDELWDLLHKDCFEVIYPVTLDVSDGTTRTVENEEAIVAIVKTERQKFSFAFPLNIKLEDGSFKEIETEQDFVDLYKSCYSDDRADWGEGNWNRQFLGFFSECFEVNFPLTLVVGDENRQQVNDFDELIETIRSNDRAFGFEFPINITIEDKQVAIESEKDLAEIVKHCIEG